MKVNGVQNCLVKSQFQCPLVLEPIDFLCMDKNISLKIFLCAAQKKVMFGTT